MATKRPNIKQKAENVNRTVERYVLGVVRPYLQGLLDKAAKRMHRHELEFSQGMGTWFFSVDGDTDTRLYRAIENNNERVCKRFPELVEFHNMVKDIDELLNTEVGDMFPTK